jgi:hypothetical protein
MTKTTPKVAMIVFTQVLVLVCLGVVPAAAQLTTPDKPVAAASGQAAGHTQHELIVSASTFGGYDTDVTEGSAVGLPVKADAPQIGGSLAMHYAARSQRVSFFGDVSTTPTHYQSVKPITGIAALASASTSVAVTRRLQFDGSFKTGYMPLFHFSVLPTVAGAVEPAPSPATDYMLTALDGIYYRGGANMTYKVSSRSEFHGNYEHGTFRYLNQDYQLGTQSFGAGYSKGVTQYARLRLGYAEQRGDYPVSLGSDVRPVRNQNIDAGIDYSRPLSLTRRTTLSFSTGSTRLDNGEKVFYDVIGHVTIQHQMKRTWNLRAVYSRGLELVGGFTDPFFADSVTANVTGNASRRVKLIGSAGYANGNLGLGTNANGYESIQGSMRVDVAVARRLTLFSNYFYYHYLFDRGIALPEGVGRGLSRHGVRAGLTFDIPVLEERKPRVTR